MKPKDESTAKMIDGYMASRESGMSNREIAEHFHVSGQTVRNHLETIARNSGVSRESLLEGSGGGQGLGGRHKQFDCAVLLNDLMVVYARLESAIAEIRTLQKEG